MTRVNLLTFVAIFLCVGLSFAHDETRTVADYDKMIVQFQTWSDNIDKPDFYKDTVLVDNHTKEKTKFSEMNDVQKDLFYLWQCEVLANHMMTLEFYWKQELTAAPARTGVVDEKDKTRSPDKKDIESYSEKLHNLRKKHAARFEKLADTIFAKQKENIPENDRKAYKARIEKWNDAQKLIERGK